MFKKNLVISAATAALVLGVASGALAASEDVGASLNAQQAISLSNVQDMSFGDIEFASTHSGLVRLGTNGAVTISAGVGLTASGTSAAGSVDISSDGLTGMEISCDASGTLEDADGDTLTLQNTEISTSAAAFGAGTACAGVGTAPLLAAAATATVYVGGEIDVSGNALTNGSYDTATGAGVPVTIDVVYQ